MASNGGRGQESRLPAVHRRLSQPRPPLERTLNSYVETPLPHRPPLPHQPPPPHREREREPHKAQVPPPPHPLPPPPLKPCKRESNFAMVNLPVTTQPLPQPGIMCTDCGRCRCMSCRTPKPLPSGFLCGTQCLCSPEACVDYATCMCVPKAFTYHCGSHDHPTSPSWLCLAASTLLCPCLLCYLPCMGCVRLCEACQRVCTTPGCRCARVYPPPPSRPQPVPMPMEKRLLDSPE